MVKELDTTKYRHKDMYVTLNFFWTAPSNIYLYIHVNLTYIHLFVHGTLFFFFFSIFLAIFEKHLPNITILKTLTKCLEQQVLSGQAKQVVTNLDDIYQALSTGDVQKRRAATAMNDRSSRAHSLFVVTMEMFHSKTGVRMKSELYLADLGGSEQVKKSKVHHGGLVEGKEGLGFQMGCVVLHKILTLIVLVCLPQPISNIFTYTCQILHLLFFCFLLFFVVFFSLRNVCTNHSENFKEAVNINLGLLALKKCISALNKGSDYIPYQDSKLTMLLSSGTCFYMIVLVP